MLWHEQSWPMIQSLDKDMPVVIPLGSLEQHGHHLPLFVDTIQVTAIAERVEREISDQILLAPTLWLGSSHHHLDFPGTISLIPSLYSQLIKSIAMGVLRAGFKRIFFLNGHGGNQVPGAQALTELVAENDDADDTYLVFSSWWHVGRESIKPEQHALTTPFISHACEYETSMMLFIRPDLVTMDRLTKTQPRLASRWFHSEYNGSVQIFRRYHRLTDAGNMGSPEVGTKEKGKGMFNSLIDEIKAFLHEFRSWPRLEKIGPKAPRS